MCYMKIHLISMFQNVNNYKMSNTNYQFCQQFKSQFKKVTLKMSDEKLKQQINPHNNLPFGQTKVNKENSTIMKKFEEKLISGNLNFQVCLTQEFLIKSQSDECFQKYLVMQANKLNCPLNQPKKCIWQIERSKRQNLGPYIFIVFLLVFLSNIKQAESSSIVVTSSSIYTGVNASYYFSIDNHTNPNNLQIQFSDWSINQKAPFISNYQVSQNSTGNGLVCTRSGVNGISCLISPILFAGSVYPTKIVLKMTGMYNPTSLKPYSIAFTLDSPSRSQPLNSNLIVSQARISNFTLEYYSYEINKQSSVQLYLQCHNYLSTQSILNLTYDSNLVTIQMTPDSSYSIANDLPGLKQVTAWNPISLGFKILKMNLTNIGFTISYTIEGILYFLEGTNSYAIQKYLLTVQLDSMKYADLGVMSPRDKILMGTSDNSLGIHARCNVAIIDSPSKQSYFKIQYDSIFLDIGALSTCSFSSINGYVSSCTMPISNKAAMTNNTVLISMIKSILPPSQQLSSVTIKISSWSYFAHLNTFNSVCSQQLIIDVSPQSLSPMVNLASCSQIVGQINSLTFDVDVQNVYVSDVITLKGFNGKVVSQTGSTSFSYDSSLDQYTSLLTNTQIVNSTRISFTVSLQNPKFIPTSSPSMYISLSRKLTSNNLLQNIYAKTQLSFNVCPVTSALSNSTNTVLTLSDTSTYKANVKYDIELSPTSIQLKDYVLNDYITVNFRHKVSQGTSFAQTQSPFQLYSFISGNAPPVILNSQYSLKSEVSNSSTLKVTLNSSSAVNLINNRNFTSLTLTMNSLSNPFFISKVFCVIKTFTSFNLQKEQIITTSSTLTDLVNSQLSIQTNDQITLLQSNNTINLKISSLSQKAILLASYSYVTSLLLVVKAPFTCANTNSTNELSYAVPSLNSSLSNIILNNCTLGYFADGTQNIQIKEYARFSHPNLTHNVLTTTSLYALSNKCGDKCHYCDMNTLKCSACFNSKYSSYSLFYPAQSKCYQNCPSGTFNLSWTCESCHAVCQQCSGGNTFNSCTRCADRFAFNQNGVCESTCGKDMFLSDKGECSSCHVNCQGCFNQDQCYYCKQGATLVGSQCLFPQCQHSCQSCQGSLTFCLTCSSGSSQDYYFYENTCLKDCPSHTFKWLGQSSQMNPRVCIQIQSSNIYFVGTILTLIALFLGVAIRCFSPKRPKISLLSFNERQFPNIPSKREDKLKETYGSKIRQSKNNLNTTQTGKNNLDPIFENILLQYIEKGRTKIYKLNLLKFMTVLMGYIQIICVLIILTTGRKYNPSGVDQLMAVGLAALLITNLIFGFKYFKNVYKKLSSKREKFIQMSLGKLAQKLQIQPHPINQNNKYHSYEQGGEIKSNNEIQLNKEQLKANSITFQQVDIGNSQKLSENYDQLKSTSRQKNRQAKKQLNEFDNQMLKELFIVGLSTLFTLRTYNILRSNLFIIFSNPNQSQNRTKELNQLRNSTQGKSLEQLPSSNSALKLPHRHKNQVIDLNKTEIIGSNKNTPLKKSTNNLSLNTIKVQPKAMVSKMQKSQSQKSVSSSLPVVVSLLQTQNLMNSMRPFTVPDKEVNRLLQIKNEYIPKFLHPFYTYLMFASLFFTTLLFAIASAILILNNRYQNMMLQGLDALIIMTISFFLNIFDLWRSVNLPRHQQNSQISTQKEQVNQTMQNLKEQLEEADQIDASLADQAQDQKDLGLTKKISTSKTSKIKNSNEGLSESKGINDLTGEKNGPLFSSKSKSPKSPSQKSDKTQAFRTRKKSLNKSSEDMNYVVQEKPPQLKIFDDLDQDYKIDLGRSQNAQKLGRGPKKNQRSSKIRSSNRTLYGRKAQKSDQIIPHTMRGNKNENYKLEDIFLGFLQGKQGQVQVNQYDQNDCTQNDQVSTVKLQGKDLQSIQRTSVINVDSEQQVEEAQCKGKSLKPAQKRGIQREKRSDPDRRQ